MKIIVGIYIVVGLILAPFVYSNNAYEYRPGTVAYKIGNATAKSVIYWPSYLFSIEPELDGGSQSKFEKSVIAILKYREEKLFSQNFPSQNEILVLSSIGNCIVAEGFGSKDSLGGVFEKLFKSGEANKALDEVKTRVMNRMDGMDFLGLIKEGEKCTNEWGTKAAISLVSPSTEVKESTAVVSEVTESIVPAPSSDCDLDYEKSIQKAGLVSQQTTVHGPDEPDFAGWGCAYRITPPPGTKLPIGSVVKFRSAWEAG